MSVPLIDWLYKDNTPGALIIFPRMIDRWNVASLIVSKWEGYKVVVVTDYPNEFMRTTTDISGTPWTDLELIPFLLVSYSNLDEINKYLHNTEIDIILFDDARSLATIAPAIDFTLIYAKILVLTTWGDTMKQLDIVTNKLPELKLLTFDIVSDTIGINWKVTRSAMTERQLKYYDLVRDREIKINSEIPKSSETASGLFNLPYPLSRMLTLYIYPDNIMAETISHTNICESDTTSYPDKLGLTGSWLSKAYIDKLCDDGPKLLSVIDGVVANWPYKQIVITRFNHRYGVDLITSFLKLMIQGKQNPYEMSEIFSISCTDEYEKILATLHKFNDSPSGVLITNIVPFISLKGISIIHMADSYSFLTLRAVLDRCHKRYLIGSKSPATDLFIYSHLATLSRRSNYPSSVKSSDEALYETFVSEIEGANRLYSGLISASGHIVFNPNLGLMVK